MKNLIPKLTRGLVLAVICAVAACSRADAGVAADSLGTARHFADYDSELRGASGRVDTDALAARLKRLGVNCYYWLIWHAATDWDDLKLFLPKAADAGIEVWVYLVPPSESPPAYGAQYSEPFRLDYPRWAEEIARISLVHSNLTGWVIDDFYANHAFFTPSYIKDLQTRARRLNPRLRFLPLMYFSEIRRAFVADYRAVIDGVVVAYPPGREDIDHAWAILNDAALVQPGELSYPWSTPSSAGDYVSISQSATVQPGQRHLLRFRERDDFNGQTAGYHFKQLLVDGQVVWEQDVAGGTNAWREWAIELPTLRGKTNIVVALRLLDKRGVSNFGVSWWVNDLRARGLLLQAGLNEPAKWPVDQRGSFEAGFGKAIKSGEGRFHIPLIVMTAAAESEFQLRHGDPPTPERIAEWLRMSLQSWEEHKCEGVVTYCLDKAPRSPSFELARELFAKFRASSKR